MQKQFLTLIVLLLFGGASYVWGGTAVFGPDNMTSQASGTLESTVAGNVWYGNGTNLATGFIIQITGNKGKALSKQGTVIINSTSYASFKNSNGAQNTITLPSGSYASSVTFYVTANDNNDATLSECNGTSYSDAVTSHKDGEHPTIITKTLGGVNSFTFTFSTKQVLFVAVVTYDQPFITTQPESAIYQKNDAASALTVAATASTGSLSYQWYSCEDANKTNASAISGATSASYTPSTSANGTFYIFCRITDSKGSTDSNVATITVSEATAPTIEVEATATSVFLNATVTLTATITGVPEPTIQWYSCDDALKTNPASIDGATNTTYAPSTAATGTYYYYAVATNSQGNASSDVITLTVNPLYTVTYSIGEVTGTVGTVPAAVDVESSVTIPTNKTLYKDGYTLTAWNDGSADHAIGSTFTVSDNTTLTPVFSANGASTYLGHNLATASWNFNNNTGAPTWNMEGSGTFVYVTQITIGGNAMDVKMTLDATGSGAKIASNDNWTQINKNSKLTVTAIDGAVVKVYTYSNAAAPTFNGNDGSFDSTNKIYSYTATADGDIDIVYGGNDYASKVEVEYPSESAVLNVTENNTQIYLTQSNVNDVDYLAVATNNWDDKTIDKTKYKLYNLSSTSRNLTIKVTGASTFEVFVYNTTANRKYNIKVGSADAQEITHGGGNLESSGVFAIADPSAETTITLSGGGNSVYPFYVMFNPAVSKAISDAGWATYCSLYALDFTNSISGLTKAYLVTGASGSALTLSEITGTIPANTGILLEGDEGTITIPVVASSETNVSANKLVGVTANTGIAAEAGYVLLNETTGEARGLGFYKNSNAFTVGANTAYLPANFAATAPSMFRLEDEENNATNAETIEANDKAVKFIQNGILLILRDGITYDALGRVIR